MTGPNTPPLWILVDGTNAVHRDAYGSGIDRAAATLGRRIETMIDRWQPAAIVAAFDPVGRTFRHDLHPEYKAGRKRLDGIDDAIEAAKQTCLSLGVLPLAVGGYEADDIIATIADVARADGNQVVIYSADKDLHQLLAIGEVTQLAAVRRDGERLACTWITATTLQEKHGVTPDQWVDWKILVGDPSDNLAGVKGIGPQTATNILAACGSIDNFCKRPFVAPISERQRVAILNYKPRLPLARQLCTLHRDVPLPELWQEGV